MQTDPDARMGQDATRDAITAFDESGFARLLGLKVLEARDSFARMVMDCSGKMNPHRVAHGGRTSLLPIMHSISPQTAAVPTELQSLSTSSISRL